MVCHNRVAGDPLWSQASPSGRDTQAYQRANEAPCHAAVSGLQTHPHICLFASLMPRVGPLEAMAPQKQRFLCETGWDELSLYSSEQKRILRDSSKKYTSFLPAALNAPRHARAGNDLAIVRAGNLIRRWVARVLPPTQRRNYVVGTMTIT